MYAPIQWLVEIVITMTEKNFDYYEFLNFLEG